MERYVAIHADGQCCGFTSKQNFDAMSQAQREVFLEDSDGAIEFEGPEYQPSGTADLRVTFAEVKRLADVAVSEQLTRKRLP